MNALIYTKTLEFPDLPPDRKSVSSKCVFKVRYNVDRSIERFKTQLVTKDFNQR